MSEPSILYRAHRLRFIIGTIILGPMTLLILALAYSDFAEGKVGGAMLALVLGGLYLWFDYIVVAKLVWPPEVEISLSGIRFSNRALFASGIFAWSEVDGPEPGTGGYRFSVPLLVMTANGRPFKVPPSHFGATYSEMAAVIEAARAGHLIDPARWRTEHPQHRLRHWMLDWGLPLLLAALLVGATHYFNG